MDENLLPGVKRIHSIWWLSNEILSLAPDCPMSKLIRKNNTEKGIPGPQKILKTFYPEEIFEKYQEIKGKSTNTTNIYASLIFAENKRKSALIEALYDSICTETKYQKYYSYLEKLLISFDKEKLKELCYALDEWFWKEHIFYRCIESKSDQRDDTHQERKNSKFKCELVYWKGNIFELVKNSGDITDFDLLDPEVEDILEIQENILNVYLDQDGYVQEKIANIKNDNYTIADIEAEIEGNLYTTIRNMYAQLRSELNNCRKKGIRLTVFENILGKETPEIAEKESASSVYYKAYKYLKKCIEETPEKFLITTIMFSSLIVLVNDDNRLIEGKRITYKLFLENYYNMFKYSEIASKENIVKENQTIDDIIEDIIITSENKDYEILFKCISVLLSQRKSILDDETYMYLNGIISDLNDNFLEKLKLERGQLLGKVYDYCTKNSIDAIKENQCHEYYAAALLKYAKYIFKTEKETSYNLFLDIFEKAYSIGCNEVEYNHLYADILRKGIPGLPGFEQDLGKAYELYVKVFSVTKQESLVEESILPCLWEWTKTNPDSKLMDKSPKEWEKIWSEVMLEKGDDKSIQRVFEEKFREDLKTNIVEIQNTYGVRIDFRKWQDDEVKKISIPENTEDVYIVFGSGKATRSFISQVVNKENCKVLLVPYNHEIGLVSALSEWYEGTNVSVLKSGVSGVFASLDLYQLMYNYAEDIDIFKKYQAYGVKKLHFMALDANNKESNLSTIVEVINQSWIRYRLYNLMAYSCTGIKFDFSEVDITVDSQAETAWYLDSVLHRFDEEFYIKINHISSADLAVRELLTEYPLFLADVNDYRQKGKLSESGRHDVVVFGGNKVLLPTLIKSLLQISGYIRNDRILPDDLNNASKHIYTDFENKIGEDFSLTIIDENADEIKDIILYDAPDLLRKDVDYTHVVPEFYDIDIHKSDFIQLLSFSTKNIKVGNENRENELKKVLLAIQRANYIVVATEDTEKSIALAMKLRTLRYQKNINDEPVISVYTPETGLDEKINQFTINKDVYEDAWHRSYHVNMFGKYQKIYSCENLFNSFFDVISKELHLDDDFRKREQKIRDYYKIVYNHKSCDSRAVAFIYGMYSVLGDKMVKDFTLSDINKISYSNRWSMELFKDYLDNYLSQYNAVIEKDGWADIIAVLEHNRWNYMMMSEGYTGVPSVGFDDGKLKEILTTWIERATDSVSDDSDEKTACRDIKLHIAKVHFAIRTFDSLGDRINISDLSSQSLEGKRLLTEIGREAFDQLKEKSNIKTVGIDKFERLLDQIRDEGKEKFAGFKTTKNREYDRKYALDMAKAMERILSDLQHESGIDGKMNTESLNPKSEMIKHYSDKSK